jgi:hypothetical protein
VRAQQQQQQAMQSVDEIAREHIRAEDEMLHNAADQDRRLDDQRRKETLSSLTGIPRTEELTLKSAADFAPPQVKAVQAVESHGDHAYPANCGPTVPNRTAPITTDLCPGDLVAMTYFCGGDTGCPYVCCPKGLPYLNHCDCKCYATEHFECPTLSKCTVQQRK